MGGSDISGRIQAAPVSAPFGGWSAIHPPFCVQYSYNFLPGAHCTLTFTFTPGQGAPGAFYATTVTLTVYPFVNGTPLPPDSVDVTLRGRRAMSIIN